MTLIVFDLDGTLIDVTGRYGASFVDSLKEHGVDISHEEVISWRRQGISPKDKISSLIQDQEKARMCNENRVRLLWSKEYLAMDVPFPYTKKVLETLGKDHSIAICSLRESYDLAKEQLEGFGILSLVDSFDTIDGGRDPIRAKKQLISKTIRDFKVPPGECYVIGDTKIDILAGTQVGATTVGVLTGLDGREILEAARPSRILESIEGFTI